MKRLQAYDDEEAVIHEKIPKRSDADDSSGLNKSNRNNENIMTDVNPDIFADYLDIKERYADLEMKYEEARNQLQEFEQTKYEEEEFSNLAAAEREDAKKTIDQVKAEKEDALNSIKTLELFIKDLNDRIDEFTKSRKEKDEKLTELQKNLEDMNKKLVTEKKQSDGLLVKIAHLELQLSESSEVVTSKDDQIAELQAQINEFTNARKEKDEKLAELQKNFEDLDKKLVTEKNQSDAFLVKIAHLELQLSESSEVVTSKDDQIAELKAQIDEFINARKEKDEKLAELQKNLEDLDKKLVTEKKQSDGLLVKIGQLESQFSESSDMVTFKDDQIAELKGQIDDLNNACKEKDEKLVTEKKQSDGLLVKVAQLESELSESSVMVTSKDDQIAELQSSNDYEPQWIVSKAECQKLYESKKSKIANFLQEYTSRLFPVVEMMLPENELDQEKWIEAQQVIFWFWKPMNNREKKLCIAALKKKMKERRQEIREKAFCYCTSNRLVAFTSDEKAFFYASNKNNIWKPFADEECQNVIQFKINRFADFGIPTSTEYSTSEYYLIFQDSPDDGKRIFKMHPSGSIECAF